MIDQEIFLSAMPGGWEMVVIALVILLMFGAKKLPELARGLGQGIRAVSYTHLTLPTIYSV